MKADDIISIARTDIKEHIVYEGIYLYTLTHHSFPQEDEDYVISFKDLCPNSEVKVILNVFDFDGYTATKEAFTLDSIHITLGENNLFFWDKNGEEHHFGEIMVDELREIADLLEMKVRDELKNLQK